MRRLWKQTLLTTVAALTLLCSLAGGALAGIHHCEWRFAGGDDHPIFVSDKQDGAAEFYSIDYGYFSGKSADDLLDNHMLVEPRARPDGSDQGCDLREAVEALTVDPRIGTVGMIRPIRRDTLRANVLFFQTSMTPFNVWMDDSSEEHIEKLTEIRRGIIDIIAGERYHQLGNGSRKHRIDETLTLTFDGDREDQLYPNGQTIILSGAIPLATYWNAGSGVGDHLNQNDIEWKDNLLLDILEGEDFEEQHWTEERGKETILNPRDYDYKAELVVDVGDGNSAFVLEGKGTLVLRDIEIKLKSGRLFENRGDVKVVLSRAFIDVDTEHDPNDAILVHRFDADSKSWNDEWRRPPKHLGSRMTFWEARNPLVLRRVEGDEYFEPQLDEEIEPSIIRLRGEAPLFADETDDVVPLFMGPHDLEWLQFDRPSDMPPPERAATRAMSAPIACEQRFPDGCVLEEWVTTALRLRSGDVVKPLHHMCLIGCAPDSSIWGIEYRTLENGEHIAILKLDDYDPETDRLVDGYGAPIMVTVPTCPDGTPMNISGTGEACPIDNGRVGDEGSIDCEAGYVEEAGHCVEKRCPEGMDFDPDAADAHEPYCSLEHDYEWDVDGNAVWPECPGETVPDGIDTPALVDPDDRFGGWIHCICPDRSEPVLYRGRLRCDIDAPADDPTPGDDGETPPDKQDDPPANEPPDDDDDDDGDDGADLNSSSDANDGCNPLTGRCDDDADDPTEDPTFSATGDADAFVSGCTLTAGGAGDARGILLILLMGIVSLALMRPRRKAA